jgi:histidinol dehydrogenase
MIQIRKLDSTQPASSKTLDALLAFEASTDDAIEVRGRADPA